MKTFHVEVENLGPIRSASFDSAHFNVLCGKNNSGKSICMHTAFCFFREWRDKIHIQARSGLAEAISRGERASFSISDYLPLINDAIEHAMPAFSRQVKNLLNKTSDSFADCVVRISFYPDYLEQCARSMWANAYLAMSAEVQMRMRKEINSETIDVWIDNRGTEEFPSSSSVAAALNRMLDFVFFERILPLPCLMTAERSGSILYGDDLRSLSFFSAQRVSDKGVMSIDDDKTHYAAPYIRELKNIWNFEQGGVKESPDLPVPLKAVKNRIRSVFSEHVAGGTFRQDDGRIYFKSKGTKEDVRLNEVSTSARALAQLNYFIDRIYDGNQLLMIDEPELNLHPARQRSLVRLLSRMARAAGVGVMITTHSDCIIRELNTLIALGAEQGRLKEVIKRHGYEEDELLHGDDVACGIVENGTIEQLEMSKGGGLSIPSFDHTIDSINAVQDDILSVWHAKAFGDDA